MFFMPAYDTAEFASFRGSVVPTMAGSCVRCPAFTGARDGLSTAGALAPAFFVGGAMFVLRPLIFFAVVLAACWVGIRFAWYRHAPQLVMVAFGLPLLWWAAIWGCPA
jgi:hypothetical protein